ncbi:MULTISPECIES: hypothetical protein [unclassified Rhodococcus (in: high G+C Gram-positive bacteria)]|uniref:hypothetical protein n=1 Tax=unclassified Rhodococcus (in: high G+C Gram-positive bacteria) TaxID=192944 RepID=UPI00117BB98E|nr:MULTISPECIES: hypothetical protein [unclassified Rhodococcus (in: high G+C Gram-positive bacteria)]
MVGAPNCPPDHPRSEPFQDRFTAGVVRYVIVQKLPVLDTIGSRADEVVAVVVGSNDPLCGRGRRERLDEDFAKMVVTVPFGAIEARAHLKQAAAAGRIVRGVLRVFEDFHDIEEFAGPDGRSDEVNRPGSDGDLVQA